MIWLEIFDRNNNNRMVLWIDEPYDANYDVMHRINRYLLISSIHGAHDKQQLEKNRIGCVINVCDFPTRPDMLKYYHDQKIQFQQYSIQDKDHEQHRLMQLCPLIHAAIQKYRRNPKHQGRSIVVHCYAGVSRSVSFVCYHLMRVHHISFQDAFQLVQKHRIVGNPIAGFRNVLSQITSQYFIRPRQVCNSRIYIGGIQSTYSKQWLLEHNIQGILFVDQTQFAACYCHCPTIQYFRAEPSASPNDQDIKIPLTQCVAFINQILHQNREGRVLMISSSDQCMNAKLVALAYWSNNIENMQLEDYKELYKELPSKLQDQLDIYRYSQRRPSSKWYYNCLWLIFAWNVFIRYVLYR